MRERLAHAPLGLEEKSELILQLDALGERPARRLKPCVEPPGRKLELSEIAVAQADHVAAADVSRAALALGEQRERGVEASKRALWEPHLAIGDADVELRIVVERVEL